MDRIKSGERIAPTVATEYTWWKLLLRRVVHSPRSSKPHDHSKNNDHSKRNRHNKYLYPIAICLSQFATAPVTLAETVGGVSATANPVANSSGSVTNQAIQVLQGPYITNTYGDGIQCQGPTLNFTPYVTRSVSWAFPYEGYYDSPVYNMLDLIGDTDSDGNAIPDGIPDSPGEILYHEQIRTGQKDNYNWNAGFSATLSWPLDRKAQDLCKEAATTHNEYRNQLLANKRLDFEIARLKNCGELMKAGISFHPKSPYYKICADVVVQNVNTVQQHRHSTFPNNYSTNADDLGLPISLP